MEIYIVTKMAVSTYIYIQHKIDQSHVKFYEEEAFTKIIFLY